MKTPNIAVQLNALFDSGVASIYLSGHAGHGVIESYHAYLVEHAPAQLEVVCPSAESLVSVTTVDSDPDGQLERDLVLMLSTSALVAVFGWERSREATLGLLVANILRRPCYEIALLGSIDTGLHMISAARISTAFVDLYGVEISLVAPWADMIPNPVLDQTGDDLPTIGPLVSSPAVESAHGFELRREDLPVDGIRLPTAPLAPSDGPVFREHDEGDRRMVLPATLERVKDLETTVVSYETRMQHLRRVNRELRAEVDSLRASDLARKRARDDGSRTQRSTS